MIAQSQRLIEDNIGLIYDYFKRHHIWDEDIKQTCMVKICENIDNYDPNKAKLSVYFNMILDSAIANEIRRSNAKMRNVKDNPTISFDAPTYTDDRGVELNLYDFLGDSADDIDELEFNLVYTDFIPFVKQNLTERQNYYLDLLLTEHTQSDIIDITGTSKQNVSFMIKTLREKILKYWEIYNE